MKSKIAIAIGVAVVLVLVSVGATLALIWRNAEPKPQVVSAACQALQNDMEDYLARYERYKIDTARGITPRPMPPHPLAEGHASYVARKLTGMKNAGCS